MVEILNLEPDNYSKDAKKFLNKIGEVFAYKYSREELIDNISTFNVLIVANYFNYCQSFGFYKFSFSLQDLHLVYCI